MAYVLSPDGAKNSLPSKYIYDFEGDTLQILEIGKQSSGKINEIHLVDKGVRQKNPWRYVMTSEDSSDFVLSVVNEDSIVLSSSYRHSKKIVLRPLSKYLHKPYRPVHLIGKAFKSQASGISHTLDFVDSSYIINTVGDYTEKVKWSLVSYKGHQFLNSNSFYLAQSLRLDSEGQILLTNYYTSINTNTYSRVASKYKREQLYGSWVQLDDENLPPRFDEVDHKIGLEISDDIFIKHFKVRDPQHWRLSNDGTFIDLSGDSLRGYRIIDLTDSTMQLQPCCDFGDNIIRHYKKGLLN